MTHLSVSAALHGLSPRMRGNPDWGRLCSAGKRSIPAYAGEPSAAWNPARQSGVYPRVCGGTVGCQSGRNSEQGPSPRMRGNRQSAERWQSKTGSIPAYAGEPYFMPSAGLTVKVYPRVCGGTGPGRVYPCVCGGLSPRMRGNRARRPFAANRNRSIPAYAGEPISSRIPSCTIRVYPRVCGGTYGGGPLCAAG